METKDRTAVFENYIRLARQERDGGGFDKASEYYSKAYEANPGSWEAYFFSCDYLPEKLIDMIKELPSASDRHEACAVIADYIAFRDGGGALDLAKGLLEAFPDEKDAVLKMYMYFYTENGDV